MSYLRESLQWITSWTFRPKFTPPCQRGFILTIRSIILMVQQLGIELGELKFICTAKLNQDCLENLFSVIRGKGGHRFNPTSREFAAAIKSASIAELTTSMGSNCLSDHNTSLINTKRNRPTTTGNQLSLTPSTSQCVTEWEDITEEAEIMDVTEVTSDCIEEEVLTYISGWLVKGITSDPLLSSCSQCEELLVHIPHTDHNYTTTPTNSSTFIKRKRYTHNANLLEPSKLMTDTIIKMEAKLAPLLKIHWAESGLLKKLKDDIQQSDVFNNMSRLHPEHSFALQEKILQKFIMCRIGAELRRENNRIQEEETRARRKLKCFTG
ncbi:uncharacterized protein LOC121724076 [Alosa sapidissima]|uniref:uncharacterized protein LOC121724076 n=1 Tax=Alosa sapidissima TaxID=34773 RepID=UPI001C0A3041|nr:uncharacterized protein LOC121724076 [Alosa sapidissima]